MARFVIGIGSQRAGSTLLHRILESATPIDMHPVKELHYFDSLHNIRNPQILKEFSARQLDRELRNLVDHAGPIRLNHRQATALRANWILSNSNVNEVDYSDLYRPLNKREVVGEITPEYMLLRGSQVQEMADTVGSNAKIILITRDPIDRFISSFKLLKVYGGGEVNKETFSRDLIDTLQSMPTWVDQQIQFSNYHEAETEFRKYFREVLVLNYESIVSRAFPLSSTLSQFLDVKVDQAKVEELMNVKVNQIGESGDISDEAHAALRDRILKHDS
ncbi:sulfotransferase [Brevibacterium litoralis]|uniref:sulfotransferase n=1 Tax=Brevibacterium litoralis TaxID=3138935 RepID=UPI0032EE67B2